MEVLFIPLLFGIAAAAVVSVMAGSRRYADQWRSAARQLELSFQAAGPFSRPKIFGTSGGLTITIAVSSSSSGSTGSVQTRYRVQYPGLGIGLRMTGQRGLARMAALFGTGDATVDDPEFDEAVIVKTTDPDRLKALLAPTTRRLLIDLVNDFRGVKIGDDEIAYAEGGIDKEAATVVATTRRLVAVARALQGEAPVRKEPRPAAPPPPEMPAEPTAPPTDGSPDPFDLKADSRIEPPQPAPPPARPDGGPEPAAVAGDLFGRRGLSFQIARRFEEAYLGRSISWQGTIREVGAAARPDRLRLAVVVATVPHELFGTVEMEIAAEIPARPGLDPGTEVRLTGTLRAIDAMSRRLVVDDARLS